MACMRAFNHTNLTGVLEEDLDLVGERRCVFALDGEAGAVVSVSAGFTSLDIATGSTTSIDFRIVKKMQRIQKVRGWGVGGSSL